MEAEIKMLHKNIRYRLLYTDEQTYLLDHGSAIWKYLCPLFFWLFPSRAYAIDDETSIDKIVSKTEPYSRRRALSVGATGGILGSIFGGSLTPLAYFLEIGSEFVTNIIMVSGLLLMLFSAFSYWQHRNKEKLQEKINLAEFKQVKVWVRAKSYKVSLYVLSFYFGTMIFGVFFLLAFINVPNFLFLVIGIGMTFLMLSSNFHITYAGTMTVKFKENDGIN